MQSWNKIIGVRDAAVVLGNLSSQVSWLPDFLPFRFTNILYPCGIVVVESKVATIWMVLRRMDSLALEWQIYQFLVSWLELD
jgi:hypothetical protein